MMRERPTPRTIMQRIGSWDLGDTLGRGAYAHVRSATHQRTREQMACKMLPALNLDKKGWNSEQLGEAVESHKERVLLLALQGAGVPGVTGMEDVCTVPDWTCTIMPDYRKTSYSLSSTHPEVVIPFFRDLLVTIKALHDLDIAHNDIKRGNVLVSNGGGPILIDFGFSQFLPSDYCIKPIGGTLEYSSPEKLANGCIDPKAADIWALGILLLRYLSVQPPYVCTQRDSAGQNAFADLVVDGEPTWYWDAQDLESGGLADLVESMLHRDPNMRLTIHDCLNHPYLNPVDLTPRRASAYNPPSLSKLPTLPPTLPKAVIDDLLFVSMICGQFSLCQTIEYGLRKLRRPGETWEKRWIGMIYQGWVLLQEKARKRRPLEIAPPKLKPIMLSPLPPLTSRQPTRPALADKRHMLTDPNIVTTRPLPAKATAAAVGKLKRRQEIEDDQVNKTRPAPSPDQRLPPPATKPRRAAANMIQLGPPRRPGLRSQSRV